MRSQNSVVISDDNPVTFCGPVCREGTSHQAGTTVSDSAARLIAAMDAQERAKRVYEELREAFAEGRGESEDVQNALREYVMASNLYEKTLAELKRRRPKAE